MRRMPQRDAGFTLIELLACMALLGVLMTLAVGPWRNYQAAQEHKAGARLVVATLRSAQVAAVAEETSYRVEIGDRAMTVLRIDPVTGKERLVRTATLTNSNISIGKSDFQGGASVTFTARGTATPGQTHLLRAGKSKVYTVTVEGLTARVSYT